MRCPSCQTEDPSIYVGFTDVECITPQCVHYKANDTLKLWFGEYHLSGAVAGGMSGEETIDYEPIDVLNLLEVREHVPVAYRVVSSHRLQEAYPSRLRKILGTHPE